MFRSILLVVAAVLLVAPRSAAQDIPESSPDAITAHVEGLRAYLAADNQGAVTHFLRAHELDPTFYVPLFMAVSAAANGGMTELYDSLWAVVKENRSRFSEYYQQRIDARVLQVDKGDVEGGLDLARATAEAYPGTKAVYQYAYYAGLNGKPRLALGALATLDRDREPMKGWVSFFSLICNSAHWVGDFAAQEACARDAIPRFPKSGAYHYQLADALASQGRVDEMEAAMEDAMSYPNANGVWHTIVGLDLWAHGQGKAAAKTYLEKALAWYEALPPERARARILRANHAYLLYGLGRYDQAQRTLEGLVADFGLVQDRAYLGISAALAGDRATATRVLDDVLANRFDLTPPDQHRYAGLLCAAMEDRDCTAAHLPKAPPLVGDHREPVLLLRMGTDPAVRAFLVPRG
jgi:tetratricopeptide (TPR) repeat protein